MDYFNVLEEFFRDQPQEHKELSQLHDDINHTLKPLAQRLQQQPEFFKDAIGFEVVLSSRIQAKPETCSKGLIGAIVPEEVCDRDVQKPDHQQVANGVESLRCLRKMLDSQF